MMKKEYITPEMILRRVILEGFIAESVLIGEGTTPEGDEYTMGDAESKSGNYNSFNVWED